MITENELSRIAVDCAFRTHVSLGPGLFESAYEEVLAFELAKENLKVMRQHPIVVVHEGLVLNHSFKADIVVCNKLLIEVKSVESLSKLHFKQTKNYLLLSKLKLGLLINFNVTLIKNGIHRIANGL